jgi:hypothetical protein
MYAFASVEHFAIRHPLRMRIEHWELSIGQIGPLPTTHPRSLW